MKRYFLGIDIGTYESRGMLIGDDFKVIADCSANHTMDNPKPGYFEHDAQQVWWREFCEISKSLIQKSGVEPENIVCVGASTLGTDCLPVDANCTPLRPAILYGIDARATEEISWLNEYYGEQEVYRLFGHPVCSGDTATKILWIKNHEPEIYKRTYKFLTGSSYITAKLTGRYVIDQFLAKGSFRPLYNADGSINEKNCNHFCRPDQLAECAYSTDIIGGITKQAAEETGLCVGTPVITGTGDSTSEAISVGLVESGTTFFQYGSSMFYYYCVNRLVKDYRSPYGNGTIKGGKVFTIPNTFCIGDGTNAAGTLTRWIRDTFYQKELEDEKNEGENAYAIMAKEAAEIKPGSDGLMILPYIYGERSPIQDPLASGIFFGLKGNHNRKHINRAALEAVGYSTYQHLILFKEMGIPPKTIITAGGGTKNKTWMQIICDMAGMPLHIPENYQCSSYGDAMLAAVGCGALRDFKSLQNALPKGTIITPDMYNHKFYKDQYEIYKELYLNNKELMHRLQTH
ncbi:FGGY-family carbohydrate kinase [Anaerocolumna sp. MB42-C2]|uniref:FGGY-family carbohydrate kinase n=1 Tax=Anaerocolumna sp. MB42-C2 TaxID=3070997 RepID=UPI0027E20EFD|nr:FGGY-family carbohydrate kinase [Anaerocolumna sp. MB42-C2]WMJ89151.1 FGGY-family carbohydrate kinase [Anaerocolumna sp. MB42-C2]